MQSSSSIQATISGVNKIVLDSGVNKIVLEANYRFNPAERINAIWFPKIVTQEGSKSFDLSFINDWKKASNPQQVVKIAAIVFRFIRTLEAKDIKLNSLKNLSAFVTQYTDYCDTETSKSWITRGIAEVKAFFGYGKRAGLASARALALQIGSDIRLVEQVNQIPS